MSMFTDLITAFVLICLIVAAGTELVRRILFAIYSAKGLDKPAWFTHLWRIVAVLIGCSCGWVADGWAEHLDQLEGLGLGAGAGVLSTAIVGVIKARIKRVRAQQSEDSTEF
mgnify:CR=1 FL=1